MVKYGECDCGKWGIAPDTFNEGKHFLRCPACNKPMFLSYGKPEDCYYSERNKVEIKEFIYHKG